MRWLLHEHGNLGTNLDVFDRYHGLEDRKGMYLCHAADPGVCGLLALQRLILIMYMKEIIRSHATI